MRRVKTICDCLDWNCFLCKYHMHNALSMCSYGIFLKSPPLKEHGQLTKAKKQLDLITQLSSKRGNIYALFLGRWKPLCPLKKWENMWPITQHPLNTNECLGKNYLNRYLALALHLKSSTDPALWLPGLIVIQRPSLELESAIIITGLFANSAVPNGSKLALYCSHSMDLA